MLIRFIIQYRIDIALTITSIAVVIAGVYMFAISSAAELEFTPALVVAIGILLSVLTVSKLLLLFTAVFVMESPFSY